MYEILNPHIFVPAGFCWYVCMRVGAIMDKTTAKDLECKSDFMGRHSRALRCVCLGEGLCVCSQSSSTYPQCNLTTNSSGSVSCVLCFSQLMSPQAEKSRQQRSCTLSWHAQQVLRFDTVLFAVAYELFQVSLWGFCHIHPFSSAYPIRITERLELHPAAVGWETGSILDMSPFLSL